MRERKEILTIALAITSVVLLGAVVVTYVRGQAEKERRIVIQKNFNDISTAKQELEGRMKDAEILNAQMKEKIADREGKIQMLLRQVDDEKAVGAKAGLLLQEKESELCVLRSKLEEDKAEKKELIERFNKLSEDYVVLKSYLKYTIKTKEELERKAKELSEKEDVSLGTIVIQQGSK